MFQIVNNWLDRRRALSDVQRLLSGQVSENMAMRIARKRSASAAYDHEFSQLMAADDCLSGQANNDDLLAMLGELEMDAPRSVLSGWPMRFAALATITTVLVAGFQFFPQQETSSVLRYVTQIGEQKVVTLSDGSEVTLNTGTEILVNLQDDYRQVLLKRGEAYFRVSPDKQRPFTVEVGGEKMTALGTEFNINRTPNTFTLAVTEGVVALHRMENPEGLGAVPRLKVRDEQTLVFDGFQSGQFVAGMMATFDQRQQKLTAQKTANMGNTISWMNGTMRFDRESLGRVISELNRYSAKKILLGDSQLMDLPVVATLRIDNINVALALLERVLPIRVEYRFDHILISPVEG